MRSLVLALILSLPAAAEKTSASVQETRLAAGKAALEKLKTDPQRRRYRDGWEAIIRELDQAVKAAPKGPLAGEAALWSARTRAELVAISHSPADMRAALAALRKVDEEYPGPAGLAALHEAVSLSWHSKEPGLRGVMARRLIERYPASAEARAVQAKTAALEHPALPALVKGAAQKPIEVGDPDDEEDAPAKAETRARTEAPGKATSASAKVPAEIGPAQSLTTEQLAPIAAAAASEAPNPAPQSAPEIAREAAKVLEEMVQDARGKAEPETASAARAPAAAKPGIPAAAEKRAPPAAEEASTPDSGDDGEAEAEEPDAPPARHGPLVRAVKNAVAALTEPEDEPGLTQKAREMRAAARSAGTSLATQLGLKIRRVVIDAGHGGKDAGASGPHGLREKDVSLAIARKVAARLKALGFQVVMTRDSDTFVPLDERTRLANEAKADLFVSIHCNAAKKRKLEGVETWTLNVASDRYAARLAAFENADADRNVSDLRLILADLATKSNSSDARDLAQNVQSSLVRTLRTRVGKVRDHGIKQALFYVLLGTHTPSILVETGFISNPAEEARLKSARYQEGTAEAIARGVKDFVDGRQKLARAF